MTEFSGQAGRMSNNQFPQESDDARSLDSPADDDTTADDMADLGADAPAEAEPGGGSASE